jgi:hypothetical protein
VLITVSKLYFVIFLINKYIYVLAGHPIPSISEGPDSLVKYDLYPMPEKVREGFEWNALQNMKGVRGKKVGGGYFVYKVLFVVFETVFL